MPHSSRSAIAFDCLSCGQSLSVPRLMAGGLTRCPHCQRWMFAPRTGVTELDLDRVQAGIDTVPDGLTPLSRPPAQTTARS